jgi:hypothetical protein
VLRQVAVLFSALVHKIIVRGRTKRDRRSAYGLELELYPDFCSEIEAGAYVFGGEIVRELPRLIVGVAQPFSKHKGDFLHPGMMSGFVSGLTDDGLPRARVDQVTVAELAKALANGQPPFSQSGPTSLI